jgi:hypothetical protein
MYDEWLHLLVSGYLHPGETFARFIMSMSSAHGQTTRRSRHRRIPVLMGGVSFLPSDIAGLQLWLDANDASTLFQDAAKTTLAGDGDVIGAWADKSGQVNDATQATTSKKPTRQDGIVGGLPVVRGDTDDDMIISVGALTNETIFAVSSHAVNNASGVIIGQPANFFLLYSATVNRVEYKYDNQAVLITGGFVETSPIILVASYDGTNQNISVNGGAFISSAVGSVSHTFTRLFSRGANVLNGDIAEILVYDSALAAGNIALVNAYLSTKWGIAIA